MGKKTSAGIIGIGLMSDKEWQAMRDCDTLIEAEKIEASPARLRAAKAEAKRRLDSLRSVADEKKD